MDLEKCKKNYGDVSLKTQQINVKITQRAKDWMVKEGLSPSSIFNEALKQLGYEE